MDNWAEVVDPVYRNLLRLAEKRYGRGVTAREAEFLMNLVHRIFLDEMTTCVASLQTG